MRQLVAVKGIGRWTAEIFLMFRLGRPDILPADDLGLMNAVQRAYGMRKRPDAKQLRKMGEAWRPYRSVAAWYLWASLELSQVLRLEVSSRYLSDRHADLRADLDLARRDRRRGSPCFAMRAIVIIIGCGWPPPPNDSSMRDHAIDRLRLAPAADRLRRAPARRHGQLQRLALEGLAALHVEPTRSRRRASICAIGLRSRRERARSRAQRRARRRASRDRRRAPRWCCAPRSRAASACRWRSRTRAAGRSRRVRSRPSESRAPPASAARRSSPRRCCCCASFEIFDRLSAPMRTHA